MANNARTPTDLERKYNFSSLLGLNKNIKINEKSITKIQNELASMLNTLIINLKDVLDNQSEVSLWFYSGKPTTSNEPYTNWTKPAEHYGDIYYDQATGYVYQFSSGGWIQNTDTSLIQAMALTNVELDTTTDNERKVYFSQPIPPYSSGDWWILEDGTLKICQLGKTSGSYDTEDFIVSSKYVATIASKTEDTITVLKGTVMKISDTYVSVEDLATGGKTVINGANITTGTINTDNVKIGNGNVQMDEEGLKLSNGAKVIGENGLMNTYIFTTFGFEQCGWLGDDELGWDNTKVTKDGPSILFNIPPGLNITSAKIILYHAPTYWGWIDAQGNSYNSWGYCRNLKLYKVTNINSRKYAAHFGSEGAEANDSTYTEISGALGSSGWTPTTPTNTAHPTENITSIDLKKHITSGLNEIKIMPSDESKPGLTLSSIVQTLGMINVMVKIDGYMSYE